MSLHNSDPEDTNFDEQPVEWVVVAHLSRQILHGGFQIPCCHPFKRNHINRLLVKQIFNHLLQLTCNDKHKHFTDLHLVQQFDHAHKEITNINHQ